MSADDHRTGLILVFNCAVFFCVRNIDPYFKPDRSRYMKIYITKEPTVAEIYGRVLKLIKSVDTNPKLLFGTISYLILVMVYAVSNL